MDCTDAMDRVRELSFAYLDDSLSEDDARELRELLERSEEARRLFVKELEFDVLLRMCFEEQRTGRSHTFTRRVMETLIAADANRRIGQRYELGHPDVTMKYRTKSKDSSLAISRNISESGACFVGTHGMNVGECVEVLVTFDHTDKPFRKKGKVVWVEEENEHADPDARTWKIGCRFTQREDGEFNSALYRQAEPFGGDSCSLCSD